jgi:hypothetical protein
MSRNNEPILSVFRELHNTTIILREALSGADEDKAHEAVTVLLMQGMQMLGAESTAMQQFYPVWEAIKSHIDNSDLASALGQTKTWERQLLEVIALVQEG